jgi:macrolide transport system ATP-binding/permease protein
MSEMLRDVRFALRQMVKTPGFTVTAVLTLALGIGANAAIFTLVHAVLLRQLPVPRPEQLVRIGDTDDCCVNGGYPDKQDYSIFSYDLYVHLRDSAPEFEQLAAMQASVSQGSVTARREGRSEPALPEIGEYVSGNYFLTFGVQPMAGRLMLPTDDAPNAPLVAVMGYQTWQRDFGSDPSVVGSTFVLNAHPFTIVGIAPQGFYGDRLQSPPGFYMPMSAEPVLETAQLLHREGSNWVYLLGRLKPGVAQGPLQAKLSGAAAQWLGEHLAIYKTTYGKGELPKVHVADRVRQYRQPGAGAGAGAAGGDVDPHGAGSIAGKADPADADREHRAGGDGWDRRSGGGVCGDARAVGAGVQRSARDSGACQSIAAGAGFCVCGVAADGGGVRSGAGVDYVAW